MITCSLGIKQQPLTHSILIYFEANQKSKMKHKPDHWTTQQIKIRF
jgi:hypothetical protein